jgi:hypothetical protein
MKKLILCLVLLAVLVGGCGGKVHGISLSLGSHERGLWTDSDRRGPNEGWGMKFDIVCGECVRPISTDGDNPWEDPDHILRFPICGPFASAWVGDANGPGFYVGLKTFESYRRPDGTWRYPWLEEEGRFLTISGSTRRTRWK